MSKASQIRQKAQEYLSKGQIEKAIAEYKRLLSVESKNPNLYNELGDIYLRAADKQQAVQNFEKAAVIYEKVALYNNAVAVCKKILRVESERIDTIFKLGELRAKQKLEGEAVTYFSQYVEYVLANQQTALPKCQREIERMLELMPASEPLIGKAAEVFDQLGLKLKAAELCAKLCAIAVEKGDAENHRRYAKKLEKIKSSLTVDEAREASAFVSDVPAPPGAEGAAPAPAPDSAERVAQPEAAVPPAPAEPRGVEEEEPSPADARTEDQSPHERPESSEPPRVEEGDGDSSTSEAIEEAEMLAAMSHGEHLHSADASGGARAKQARDAVSGPTSAAGEPHPAEPAAWNSVGTSPPDDASRLQDRTEAERGLAEEITSDVEKDDLRSHYDLGMAYLEMGLYNEAVKDFQIASRCEELKLSSMEMIGHCFIRQENPRLAVKQLVKALEIAKSTDAESLGIHYNLGLAYEMLGDLEGAREHFEEVYIVDMTFHDVADKMQKLSTIS